MIRSHIPTKGMLRLGARHAILQHLQYNCEQRAGPPARIPTTDLQLLAQGMLFGTLVLSDVSHYIEGNRRSPAHLELFSMALNLGA